MGILTGERFEKTFLTTCWLLLILFIIGFIFVVGCILLLIIGEIQSM